MITPESSDFNPSRRNFLKLVGKSAAALIDYSLIMPAIILTQPDIIATLEKLVMGKTTDAEVSRLPFLRKEDVEDRSLNYYSFRSSLEYRPHIVITRKGGAAQFMRINPGPNTWISAGLKPDARITAPLFYGGQAFFSETLVFADKGFAVVTEKNTRGALRLPVHEEHYFIPSSSSEYVRKWGQGDYNPYASYEDTPQAKSVLILADGLGSNSQSQRQKLGSLKEALDPDYDEIIYFSYADGEEYEAKDTYQDLDRSASKYRRTVDRIKNSSTSVDGMGYSLGGNVQFRYASNFIVPPNGPHKDGYIRSLICVSSPLNGLPDPLISTFVQAAGIPLNTQAGNEATEYVTALARNPEAQDFTRRTNIATARFLRNTRAINLITLGSSNDCLITEESAIIEGFGGTLPLENGIPNCDSIFLALIPPGRVEDKIGHTQMVTDPRGISEIRYSLRSAYA